MKKILLLLVIMLTVPALFAQYDYQRGTRAKPAPEGSRATPVTGGTRAKPAPEGSRARSITSGTRATSANGEKKNPKPHYEVLPKIVNDTTIEQKVGEASSEAPAAEKKKGNSIEVASGPCENAPTVTFGGKTFELNCNKISSTRTKIWNQYINTDK